MSTVPHGEPCQAGPVRYELLRSSRRTAALEITSEGRVLVRPSGTEALMRVMVEAKTQEKAQETAQRLADLIPGL